MNLHPEPAHRPIPVKDIIPASLGTRSQRINPWISADKPAATSCKSEVGYELKEARINPTCQSYRVLTGQERKTHFGLVRWTRTNRVRRYRSRRPRAARPA